MRLTCKTLADVVASLVLSKIIIQAEEVTKIEELLSDLRSITDPQRVAVNCTREITFRIFSTNHRECVGDLSRDLNAALTSLRLVRTVKYANRSIVLHNLIFFQVGTREDLILFGYKKSSGTPSRNFPTSVT